MVDTMREPNNYQHYGKVKTVIVDGKEVMYNPEEEEDPRLVKAILEAEKGEFTEPMTLEQFRKHMEELTEDED